ncbi:RNase H domain-containing protein [Trichonephila clavipes]|nr:RNase H domain-containing protein [Trichonephila clavipes]
MTIVLEWSIKFLGTERKVSRSNPFLLPSTLWTLTIQTKEPHPARISRGSTYPPQNPPSRQTLTQLSRHYAKLSHRNDAILKPSRTNDATHKIHFQWIPSHVNIVGNEIAGSLARAGAGETTTPATPLTYLELFSKYKAKNKAIWMIPLVHPWYQSTYPGGSLVRGSSRRDQTALTRFFSGHLMSLTFVDGIKHFEICTCSSLPWPHFILFGAYQAGLGSRSPIDFGLLQGEWTHGPDLAML